MSSAITTLCSRDSLLLDRIVTEWKTGKWDAIKLRCFNEADAKEWEERVAKACPEVKLVTTWLKFRDPKED